MKKVYCSLILTLCLFFAAAPAVAEIQITWINFFPGRSLEREVDRYISDIFIDKVEDVVKFTIELDQKEKQVITTILQKDHVKLQIFNDIKKTTARAVTRAVLQVITLRNIRLKNPETFMPEILKE